MHSNFSCDCDASMEQMCRGAIANGISLLGFTEHYDLLPDDPCYDFLDVSGWWSELARCRELFDGQLTILAGIELGEPHRYPDRMERLLGEHAWDYALGSLHWVGDWLVFDPGYFQRPAEEAYRRYFGELLQMVETAEFDVLAHMDVVKRQGYDSYGSYAIEPYEREARAVLRAMAERDLALEINTASLRRAVAASSPAQPMLDWFRQEGGERVTLGSDAHRPEHIGFELPAMAQQLQAAGFPGATWFEGREPRLAA